MEGNKIIIILGASSDHFGAYAVNCPGIYGAGKTVMETKENVLEGLRLFVETTPEVPEVLRGEYEIEFRFDVPAFLKHYSTIFTKSALERLTGINQTQLSHYVSGFRKPSRKTIEKLDKAIHELSDELSQVNFV